MSGLTKICADVSLTGFAFDQGHAWSIAHPGPTIDAATTEAAIVVAAIQIHTKDDSLVTETLLVAAFVRGVLSASH